MDIIFNDLEKFKSVCRLCLTNEQDVNIFEDSKFNLPFHQIITFLTNIKMIESDNLPDKICQECSSKLILFYKFKQKCESSNCMLTALFSDDLHENSLIKSEDELECSDIIIEEFIEEDDITNEFEIEIVDPTEIEIQEKEIEKPKTKRIHQCDQCGRIFQQKSALKQHDTFHTGLKKFSCSVCDKKFTRKSHLQIHMRRHNNERPYICEICSRTFSKSGDLARHHRIHKDDKNYSCSVCDRRFKRSSDVLSHMRTHTGDRPYKCDKCEKAYSSHSTLKKHKLTHENLN